MDMEPRLKKLNNVEPTIQFSIENEAGRLPFLDTVILRDGSTAKHGVYRKPTSKEDYIHFHSGHHLRYKRGMVIGFFLRSYRICSSEFLKEGINHTFTKFTELKYPRGLLIQLQKKPKINLESPSQERFA